jgi:hypothetical protein
VHGDTAIITGVGSGGQNAVALYKRWEIRAEV